MMNKHLVRKLLLYIVDQFQDMEAEISTIRLVKMLYLIDLEYYIRHDATLTGIEWVYYHFGPYFFAVGDILRSASIDLDAREITTRSGKGYTYRSLESQDISKDVDFATEQQINHILQNWALEDTDSLLKFVYSTPPIKAGQRERPIDFSLAIEKKQPEKTTRHFTNPAAYHSMLASESVLARGWDTPEEDKAWAYLSKRAK
jgi:hypothetical protein